MHRRHDEHRRVTNQKVTKFYQNQHLDPFVHLLFYRVGGKGYRTNSRVMFGGGGCGEIVASNFA